MGSKNLDWRPVRQFLNSRNIKEIKLKNMLNLGGGAVTKIKFVDNKFIVTLTKETEMNINDLKEERCLDIFTVLNSFMKNPSVDGAIFRQYISSLKRTENVQKVLNAWVKKKVVDRCNKII